MDNTPSKSSAQIAEAYVDLASCFVRPRKLKALGMDTTMHLSRLLHMLERTSYDVLLVTKLLAHLSKKSELTSMLAADKELEDMYSQLSLLCIRDNADCCAVVGATSNDAIFCGMGAVMEKIQNSTKCSALMTSPDHPLQTFKIPPPHLN